MRFTRGIMVHAFSLDFVMGVGGIGVKHFRFLMLIISLLDLPYFHRSRQVDDICYMLIL